MSQQEMHASGTLQTESAEDKTKIKSIEPASLRTEVEELRKEISNLKQLLNSKMLLKSQWPKDQNVLLVSVPSGIYSLAANEVESILAHTLPDTVRITVLPEGTNFKAVDAEQARLIAWRMRLDRINSIARNPELPNDEVRDLVTTWSSQIE
jgi:hypothetical protein